MKIAFITVISILIQFIGLALYAQKIEINFNAAANLTNVSTFTNRVLITNGGLIIPDMIDRRNSAWPPIIGNSQSESTAKIGVTTELELGIRTNEKTKISLILGLNQMNFQYDSYVDFDNAVPCNLSELDQDYGKTNLLYFEVKPTNLSYALYKKLIVLQFGPTLDFLVKSQQNNIVVSYSKIEGLDGSTYEIIDKIHFDSTDDLSKVLYGFYLRTGILVFKKLNLTISGQYYFNSIYKNSESYGSYTSACKPIQLQLGLSYTFLNFGEKNK